MRIAVFEVETGRIMSVVAVPQIYDCDLQPKEGESWIAMSAGDASTHYVHNPARDPEIRERPVSRPAEGGTAPYRVTLDGRPKGSKIRVTTNTGQTAILPDPNDPDPWIDLETPGPYEVEIEEPWPARIRRQTVEVT